jgi:hypothetical protein
MVACSERRAYVEALDVNSMVIKVLPNFYKLISSNKHKLNDNEFKTCILIRLHFSPKEISNMLDVSSAYVCFTVWSGSVAAKSLPIRIIERFISI